MSRFDCRFTDGDGVNTKLSMPTEDDARREGEVLRALAGSLRLSACAAWRKIMMDGCRLFMRRMVYDQHKLHANALHSDRADEVSSQEI